MIILGIRCSTSEFSFAIIEGTLKTNKLLLSARTKYPNGYNHCELLKWLHNEIGDLITKYKPNGIGVKGTEAMGMKGKSYGERMELEAMIFLQAAENGIKYAKRKVNGTIAKDLGLKGKGKYLADGVDYSGITDFEKLSQHLQEAVQVALSMLN
jgi:hypothetical protein